MMKTFKIIDLAGQILLITGFAVAQIINKDETFLVGYFVVGLWQATSMVIHYSNKWHPCKGGRRYQFQLFTAGFFLLFGISALINQVGYLFYFLLIASPFIAVYYLWICYREIFFYSKRPLQLI